MKKLLSLIIFLCGCLYGVEMRFYPDSILFHKCEEVKEEDKSVVALLDSMLEELLKSKNGAGLAAPQVGVSKRVIVLNIPDLSDLKLPATVYKIINPKIVWKSEEFLSSPEGCISMNGAIGAVVMRHASVSVEYLNEKFAKCVIEKATGLLACCLQHEIDHLDGKLYINRLNSEKVYKVMFIDQVREEMKEKGREGLSECVFIDKSDAKEYAEGVQTLKQIQKDKLLLLDMSDIPDSISEKDESK